MTHRSSGPKRPSHAAQPSSSTRPAGKEETGAQQARRLQTRPAGASPLVSEAGGNATPSQGRETQGDGHHEAKPAARHSRTPQDRPRRRGPKRPFLGPTEAAGAVDLALDPVEFNGEAQAAGCTEMEIQAVLLWVECRSIREVADTLGLSRPKVRLIFLSVLDKLRRHRARRRSSLTSAQILGVYCQEVNRFGYTGEHHCRPGEEACRDDGLCKRRWYLFGEEAL